MNLDTKRKVDAIESAIDSLFDDVDCVDDELLASLERVVNKAGVLRATCAKSWVDSGVWAKDPGLLSGVNALARCVNIPRTHAHTMLQTAKTLEEFPSIKDLAVSGSISVDHVRSISATNEPDLTELLHENEKFVCEIAKSADVQQFSRAMRQWKEYARAYTNTETTPQLFHGRRSFHLSQMLDGMYKLDATLAPDEGLMLQQFIVRESDAQYHAQSRAQAELGDSESDSNKLLPSQLRADAFAVLIRSSIAEYSSQRSQPVPLITVDVDYNQLCDRAKYNPLEKMSEQGIKNPTTSDLDTNTLLKLACDAHIVRQITDGPTHILEQGRTTRVVSLAMRRYLKRRDQHCTFPGCDNPANWCDAHHIHHWAHGGKTDRNNLVLLCSTHHDYIHENNYEITITKNGATYQQRAGP